MARDFIPKPYQVAATKFILNVKRAFLAIEMGLGKTIISTDALLVLHDVLGDVGPALIVGPLRVARRTWSEEAARWNHTKHLKVLTVAGTPAQRLDILRTPAHAYAINYELLPWLVEYFEKKKIKIPFGMVIAVFKGTINFSVVNALICLHMVFRTM